MMQRYGNLPKQQTLKMPPKVTFFDQRAMGESEIV